MTSERKQDSTCVLIRQLADVPEPWGVGCDYEGGWLCRDCCSNLVSDFGPISYFM